MSIPDPIAAGLARGWKVSDGAQLAGDLKLSADVVIVGSGAGGGMAAELLAKSGLKVILLEEGALRSSRDFRLDEAKAYPELYQESANRQTADKGITILQGRTVGGSTVVNWTTSFRTPPDTLRYWQGELGLKSVSEEAMAPWFAQAEQRLNISDWALEPNPNNSLLGKGCDALGVPHARIRRNVKGCWNTGYCGMGCPTNAKQSMLVTTIPAALDAGAQLLTRMRVERLVSSGDGKRINTVEAVALDAAGIHPTGRKVTIAAKEVVLSAGAIGTPAVLLRSGLSDPSGMTGKRTFLHPVSLSGALFEQEVKPFSGAPQTVYTDHFMHTQAIDGPLGYKLEVPPVHPLLMGATMSGFGPAHAELMKNLPHLQVTLALLRDGFHPDSQGGQVKLRGDGSPLIDYPLNDVVWDGVRRSWLTMAEIQFAAGARTVMTVHESAKPATSWNEAKAQITALPLKPVLARVVSAHVMGGAAMGKDERSGVVDEHGRHWGLRNLTVIDGSIFPTSIGANPQLSVYGFSLRAADALRRRMAQA
jgi:choline dehydrogenase-like flavoprotein